MVIRGARAMRYLGVKRGRAYRPITTSSRKKFSDPIFPFLFNVVPTLRSASSASPVLLTGKDSVVQTTQLVAPGRPETRFLETSSILTTARPLASCPVTTRLSLSDIVFLLPSEMENVSD